MFSPLLARHRGLESQLNRVTMQLGIQEHASENACGQLRYLSLVLEARVQQQRLTIESMEQETERLLAEGNALTKSHTKSTMESYYGEESVYTLDGITLKPIDDAEYSVQLKEKRREIEEMMKKEEDEEKAKKIKNIKAPVRYIREMLESGLQVLKKDKQKKVVAFEEVRFPRVGDNHNCKWNSNKFNLTTVSINLNLHKNQSFKEEIKEDAVKMMMNQMKYRVPEVPNA